LGRKLLHPLNQWGKVSANLKITPPYRHCEGGFLLPAQEVYSAANLLQQKRNKPGSI